MPFTATPLAQIPNVVASVRSAFNTQQSKDLAWRKNTLRQLYAWIDKNEKRIIEALNKDLHRSDENFSYANEVMAVLNEIAHALEHIDEWTRPEKPASVPLLVIDSKAETRFEPYGTVLIIGAWNYPWYLTVGPLVGAITAGCSVVLKPSEVSPHTAALVEDLVRELKTPHLGCVNGAVEETTALLKEKFDLIFYTGNGVVGKIIMTAAAKHLTPVVLELGGKSPVYVDKDCDFTNAARRIIWAKVNNMGQTCIAPDYILVHKDAKAPLAEQLKKAIKDFYGEDPQKCNAVNRIVNSRHFSRLENVLNRQRRIGTSFEITGGKTDANDLYIAPTIFSDVSLTDPIMEDEIFGPLLPIVTVQSDDEAISIINSRDHPLSLYVFTNQKKVAEKVISRTNSGAAIVNDLLVNMLVHELPFGGVGGSGMGSWHGHSGFLAFSHRRATLWRPMGGEAGNSVRYANADPKLSRRLLDLLVKRSPPSVFWLAVRRIVPSTNVLGYVLAVAIGVFVGLKARI